VKEQTKLKNDLARRQRHATAAITAVKGIWAYPRGCDLICFTLLLNTHWLSVGAPQLQALWKERFKTLSLCNEGYSILEEQGIPALLPGPEITTVHVVIAGRRHDGVWLGSLPLAPQQSEGGVQIDADLGANQIDTIGNADVFGNLRKTPEPYSGGALDGELLNHLRSVT
jgi:hypothetical protein